MDTQGRGSMGGRLCSGVAASRRHSNSRGAQRRAAECPLASPCCSTSDLPAAPPRRPVVQEAKDKSVRETAAGVGERMVCYTSTGHTWPEGVSPCIWLSNVSNRNSGIWGARSLFWPRRQKWWQRVKLCMLASPLPWYLINSIIATIA